MKILFVCAGNICRSPTAEGVMARLPAERCDQVDEHEGEDYQQAQE